MKKWARICNWLAFIWIILLLLGLVFLYIKTTELSAQISQVPIAETDNGNLTDLKIIPLLDLNSPFKDLIRLFLITGIPAWILLLISLIWGRESK